MLHCAPAAFDRFLHKIYHWGKCIVRRQVGCHQSGPVRIIFRRRVRKNIDIKENNISNFYMISRNWRNLWVSFFDIM